MYYDPFDDEYWKRYGVHPFYEKDFELVNKRMDEIWQELRMTDEEKEMKLLREQCPWS